MKYQKKRSKWKTVLFVLLLAVLCIGGMELVVCRVMDPVLYQTITAPVRREAHALAGRVQDAWSSFTASLEAPPPEEIPEEELPESQYASDPAVWDDLSRLDEYITRLSQREGDGQEVLTGGSCEVVYYNQSDDAWASLPYGSNTIGGYGCGPTAIAMAVSSLTEQTATPSDIAQWAKDNGHWARGRGSYNSIAMGAADFGLIVEPCQEYTAAHLREQLSSGKLAVALMAQGHFTQRGHFILLRGATLDGSILVADPNSRDRSLALWDAQLILDELAPSGRNGAPLWFLSNYNITAD